MPSQDLKLVVMSNTDRTTHNNPLFYSSCWRPLHYSLKKKKKKLILKARFFQNYLFWLQDKTKKTTLILQGKEEKMD